LLELSKKGASGGVGEVTGGGNRRDRAIREAKKGEKRGQTGEKCSTTSEFERGFRCLTGTGRSLMKCRLGDKIERSGAGRQGG